MREFLKLLSICLGVGFCTPSLAQTVLGEWRGALEFYSESKPTEGGHTQSMRANCSGALSWKVEPDTVSLYFAVYTCPTSSLNETFDFVRRGDDLYAWVNEKSTLVGRITPDGSLKVSWKTSAQSSPFQRPRQRLEQYFSLDWTVRPSGQVSFEREVSGEALHGEFKDTRKFLRRQVLRGTLVK